MSQISHKFEDSLFLNDLAFEFRNAKKHTVAESNGYKVIHITETMAELVAKQLEKIASRT